MLVCCYSSSIAEGDSEDDDDDGDIILENECLTVYNPHPANKRESANLNGELSRGGTHPSNIGRPLPQSVSLPGSIGASLGYSSHGTSGHNGSLTRTTSSSQDSIKDDGSELTL